MKTNLIGLGMLALLGVYNIPGLPSSIALGIGTTIYVPSIVAAGISVNYYHNIPWNKHTLITGAIKSVIVWNSLCGTAFYVMEWTWAIFPEEIADAWKNNPNSTCAMDSTLFTGPIFYGSILQYQFLKLLLTVDTYRFLAINHEFWMPLSYILPPVIMVILMISLYFIKGSICDKSTLIAFATKWGFEVDIDEIHVAPLDLKKVCGACILLLEIIRRIYLNWNKIQNKINLKKYFVAKPSDITRSDSTTNVSTSFNFHYLYIVEVY